LFHFYLFLENMGQMYKDVDNILRFLTEV